MKVEIIVSDSFISDDLATVITLKTENNEPLKVTIDRVGKMIPNLIFPADEHNVFSNITLEDAKKTANHLKGVFSKIDKMIDNLEKLNKK